LQELEEEGRACYLEPGLWVAAEELELYQDAFQGDGANLQRIIRRSLRYRGAAGDLAIAERYALSLSRVQEMLEYLLSQGVIVPWDDLYVHKDLYDRASGARRTRMRATVVTAPGESYAHYLARQVVANSSPQEELQEALQQWQGFWYPYQRWGEVILPARVPRYQSRMLDTLIQSGQFVWRLNGEGGMRFDIPSLEEARSYPPYTNLAAEEEAALELLQRRGALFSSALLPVVPREKLPAVLLSLLSKGYITNDSTLPLTLLDAKEQEGKAKVQSRVALLESGRWEALPQLPELSWEELLRRGLNRWGILCRETAQQEGIPWSRALDTLRHWEYIGEVRRGYFVRGLSGAQFILNATAPQLMAQLAAPGEEYICLLACDPAQAYGSLLPHVTAAAFTLIPGTAVVLKGGVPVLLIERQGAVMRILDDRPLAAVQCFVERYRQGRIWPKKRNITVKNPSSELGDILLGAGFARSMLDFVLYRS
ncbi:MAG: hypothetical protein FWF06_03250, partial [Symbiobacteriaceae bacterium]|nr:hypothetical protein [Symbiobacteriaceae bacterium]